jgi:TfoX/Sxy family transcriptional regulator of competence genes
VEEIMAYSENVAERLRHALKRRQGVSEKKMFGGLAFLMNGNMCCGVVDDNVVLRLGKDGAEKALEEKHIREMDFTGTPLASMVYLRPAGYKTDEDLRRWVQRAADFTRTLPAK